VTSTPARMTFPAKDSPDEYPYELASQAWSNTSRVALTVRRNAGSAPTYSCLRAPMTRSVGSRSALPITRTASRSS
jgi:hypothetical protein